VWGEISRPFAKVNNLPFTFELQHLLELPPLQANMSTPLAHSSARRPLSRPTTPLRASSRSSLRESNTIHGAAVPLEALEPEFAELSDSMADLEANFMHLQIMHESLARFSENFASFLYGLNMNAFCVDFPEVSLYTRKEEKWNGR